MIDGRPPLRAKVAERTGVSWIAVFPNVRRSRGVLNNSLQYFQIRWLFSHILFPIRYVRRWVINVFSIMAIGRSAHATKFIISRTLNEIARVYDASRRLTDDLKCSLCLQYQCIHFFFAFLSFDVVVYNWLVWVKQLVEARLLGSSEDDAERSRCWWVPLYDFFNHFWTVNSALLLLTKRFQGGCP